MTGAQIDYAAVYRQLPIPVLLLTPEFAIADVNQASLQATGRTRDELLGRDVFDAFPSNPSDPGATTVRNTIASLRQVLATGEPYAMEFQKSDIEVPGSPGLFARYYWSGVNAPVLGPDGRVELIAIMAEDVTDRLHRFMSAVESDEMYDEDSGLAARTAGAGVALSKDGADKASDGPQNFLHDA